MAEAAMKRTDLVEVQAERGPVMTPLQMLDRALSSGADVGVLDKLMTLQERWEANQGRKAFDEALAAARAEIPAVVKDKAGHTGRYASFGAIAKAIDPILPKHGLSYRFRTEQTDRIRVTCLLSHSGGYREENSLAGPPDTSGSKNALQSIGSTLTYLHRYTLLEALGIAVTDVDDDGAAAVAGARITDEQQQQLLALADKVGATQADERRLLKRFNISDLPDLPASKFQEAVDALSAMKGSTK